MPNRLLGEVPSSVGIISVFEPANLLSGIEFEMLPVGPDKGWSWVVVVCCAYMNLAFFGLVRSSGVMYVAFLHNYGVTREEASWPFSLCSAMFQLVGPLASVLMHYLTMRKACIIGSSIATLGVVCCYFATSITMVNIFYGVIHGIGFGLVATLIPMIVNQYFVRHRASAMGIAFSGGSLSSFIFPVAIEFLLKQYDLPGTFLILGGIVMNTIVASSLIRTPEWLKKQGIRSNAPAISAYRERKSSICTAADFAYETVTIAEKYADSIANNKALETEQHRNGACLLDPNKDPVPSATNGKSESAKQLPDSNRTLDFNGDIPEKFSSYRVDDKKETLPFLDAEKQVITIVPPRKMSILERKNKEGRSDFVRSVIDVLHNPMFYVLLFTINIFFTGMLCFFMTIVDFSKDKGIPEQESIYALFAFSITDLFGRLGLGWITDRGYVKAKHMLMVNMAAIGLFNNVYPFVNTLTGIMAVATVHGVFVGGTVSLLFVLQADYMGMEKLPLALGLSTFVNGLSTFFRPPMIGLFRDVIGTYDWLFHFLGIIHFIITVVWMAEPWLQKINKRRIHAINETSRSSITEHGSSLSKNVQK